MTVELIKMNVIEKLPELNLLIMENALNVNTVLELLRLFVEMMEELTLTLVGLTVMELSLLPKVNVKLNANVHFTEMLFVDLMELLILTHVLLNAMVLKS